MLLSNAIALALSLNLYLTFTKTDILALVFALNRRPT